MKINKLLFVYIIVLLTITTSTTFTKKPITFEDILKFEDLNSPSITDNGKWVTYRFDKQRGNNSFIIQSTETDKKVIVEKGKYAQYSEDTKWFAIKTDIDVIKQLNLDENKNLKSGLELINTSNDYKKKIDNVSGFNLTKNGQWLVYTIDYEKKEKQKGKKLIFRHLVSETEIPVENVVEYTIDSLGNNIFYSTLIEKGFNGIYTRDLKEEYAPEKSIDKDSSSKYSNLTWDETLSMLLYLKGEVLNDDKTKDNAIVLYDNITKLKLIIADTSSKEGYYIPEINQIRFTEDDFRLWFGYKPLTEWYGKDNDTTKITEDNLYNTDLILDDTQLFLWHPKDPEIIPYQQTNWNRNKENIYYSIYDINTKSINHIADSTETGIKFDDNPNYTIQYDYEPYKKLMTYSGWYYDLYSVDIRNGNKFLIEKNVEQRASLSPDGLYTVFFKNKKWYSHNNRTNTTIVLNDNLDIPFYDVMDDHPKEPGSYSLRGWVGNDQKVLIGDQFDIWEFDLANAKSRLVSKGFGRKNEITINPINLHKNKRWFEANDKVFTILYGVKNKKQQFGLLDLATGNIEIKTQGEYLHNFLEKSDNSHKLIFTKEGFNTYPDIWMTTDKLADFEQISEGQKQVDEFLWGTSHLVDFVTKFGDTLQGYYALPDNYKKGKKYPVFVYFYEKFSDRKNQFNMPKINHRPPYSLYLGSDYVMFFPDVKFYDGNPGESSQAALIAGCDKLVEMGIADPEKIVMHGHSWSGYESAWIVTQTDYFAACVSGAPVSNMTSAYSGIRLGSGLARQFQYEKEQSRIGGNIIDSLDSYIRNSPIFFADQMNTPLLVMFGDIDEAVPWQQGIELYLAMRRFDKNCIFLQYEGEPHHPKKIHNQLDYSMRMKQFMDYYTLGGEMPKWMMDGFKYKGKYNTGR